MKVTVIYTTADNTEADVFTEDGGACSIYHNQEHIVTMHYQDRCSKDDPDIWDKLSEGKAYISDWEDDQTVTEEIVQDAIDWLIPCIEDADREIVRIPFVNQEKADHE